MQVTIASGNIFRRELTSYVLGDAGYTVAESVTIDGLLACLALAAPDVLVLDVQLAVAEPGGMIRAIRQRTRAPILWIGGPAETRALIVGDERPADALTWPFHAAELLSRVALLLGRCEAGLATDEGLERSVGGHE